MRAPLLILGLLVVMPIAAADDSGVGFDPAAHAGLFPPPEDVQAVVAKLADHPWAEVHQVGASLDGLPISVVAITDPESPVPMEERVVTFIMTQQHGNEPAGTPAAMQLLEELDAGGPATEMLDNQVLLVMPQSNPDGAIDDRRSNEDGADINRDHVGLETPEAKAIHKVLDMWDVHLAMDHHEYGGIGLGYPSPVHVYDYDITTMFPRHGNVRQPTLDLALELNYDHIYPYVRDRGYTIGDYGMTTVGVEGGPREDIEQTAGGPDPGILRNNYGLNNVVGLLVETFVSPDENPLHSYERRVGAHDAVMDAVLEYGHENAQRLIETKRASERLNREEPMQQYIEGETSAGLAGAYHTNEDLGALFALHALPAGITADGGYVHNLDHGRSGLVAAILHPDSSRAVADGHATEPVANPPAYAEHRDYVGPQADVEDIDQAPEDEEAPGLMPLVAVGAVVALAWARRR